MKHLLSATALVATIAFSPAIASANNLAHERCKQDEDNRQILGGLAGAVLGAVAGSQLAGRGARTEGSVIAGTIGALAGAGIADKTIDCDPVYPQQQGYSQGTSYSNGTVYPSQGTTYQGTTYSGSSSHGNTVQYGGTQTHQNRVTVSDHPVYSNPSYGATTYPASSSSQYVANSSSTYSAPVTTYASAPTSTYYSVPTTTTYASQPSSTYYSPSYTRTTHNPQFRTVRTSSHYESSRARRRGLHYHGRHSCDMRH